MVLNHKPLSSLTFSFSMINFLLLKLSIRKKNNPEIIKKVNPAQLFHSINCVTETIKNTTKKRKSGKV